MKAVVYELPHEYQTTQHLGVKFGWGHSLVSILPSIHKCSTLEVKHYAKTDIKVFGLVQFRLVFWYFQIYLQKIVDPF